MAERTSIIALSRQFRKLKLFLKSFSLNCSLDPRQLPVMRDRGHALFLDHCYLLETRTDDHGKTLYDNELRKA